MNFQNEVYHGVLSPGRLSGLVGMYQPFMTSWRNPCRTKRSRWVRLRSAERIATISRSCSALRAWRDSASLSVAVANGLPPEADLRCSIARVLSCIIVRLFCCVNVRVSPTDGVHSGSEQKLEGKAVCTVRAKGILAARGMLFGRL